MNGVRDVWRLGFLLMSFVALGMVSGCNTSDGEDKDDTPGDPVAISGGSVLRVTVEDYITNIYFDGNYLGTVENGHTQDYSVPAGEHVVKFTNAEKDNQEPDSVKITFMDGYIHTVTVKWEEESLF